MALKGDVNTLKKLRRVLKDAPRSVAHAAAKNAAPVLTKDTRSSFRSGKTVYGEARPRSEVDGAPLTLRKSGDVERMLAFTSNGTIVRAVLGTPYAKYLIGKYSILPNGPLPTAWAARLAVVVKAAKVKL